jgi:hypothetical protein
VNEVPGGYSPGWWSSYYTGWGYSSPGYLVTEEYVTWEMTLWDARAEDRLAWTAAMETTNPSAGKDFVKSVTKSTVESLTKTGLIPPDAQ